MTNGLWAADADFCVPVDLDGLKVVISIRSCPTPNIISVHYCGPRYDYVSSCHIVSLGELHHVRICHERRPACGCSGALLVLPVPVSLTLGFSWRK